MAAATSGRADGAAAELTATGADARTRPLLEKLGEHARELIGKELVRLDRRIEQLNRSAADLVIDHDLLDDEIRRRGLDGQQRRELEEIGEYLAQIARAVRTGRRAAVVLNGPREKWDALLGDADALAERVAEVRDRRD